MMRRPKLLSDGSRQQMSYRTDAGRRHASPRLVAARPRHAAAGPHRDAARRPTAPRAHHPGKTALNGTTIGT